MSMRANVNDPPSPQYRTRGFAENWRGSAIALLTAGGLICLVVGMIYLNARVYPAVSSLGQFLSP